MDDIFKVKCKCGNQLGKPMVNPHEIRFTDPKTKQDVLLPFMAGMVTKGNVTQCWFCAYTHSHLYV